MEALSGGAQRVVEFDKVLPSLQRVSVSITGIEASDNY